MDQLQVSGKECWLPSVGIATLARCCFYDSHLLEANVLQWCVVVSWRSELLFRLVNECRSQSSDHSVPVCKVNWRLSLLNFHFMTLVSSYFNTDDFDQGKVQSEKVFKPQQTCISFLNVFARILFFINQHCQPSVRWLTVLSSQSFAWNITTRAPRFGKIMTFPVFMESTCVDTIWIILNTINPITGIKSCY